MYFKDNGKKVIRGLEAGGQAMSYERTFFSCDMMKFILSLLDIEIDKDISIEDLIELFKKNIDKQGVEINYNQAYIDKLVDKHIEKKLSINKAIFKKSFLKDLSKDLFDELISKNIEYLIAFKITNNPLDWIENNILTHKKGYYFGIYNQSNISYQIAQILKSEIEELTGKEYQFVDVYEKGAIANNIRLSQVEYSYQQDDKYSNAYNEAIDIINEKFSINNQENNYEG